MKTTEGMYNPYRKEISINDKSDFNLKSSFNAFLASLLTCSLSFSPSRQPGTDSGISRKTVGAYSCRYSS